MAYLPLRDVLTAERGPLFSSDWTTVDREHLDLFERATYETPADIDYSIVANSLLEDGYVDGFLMVAMLVHFHWNYFPYRDADTWALNYGLNRVRFPAAVWLGERIRCHARLVDATERRPGRILVTSANTIERKGSAKPVMTAEWVCLFIEGRRGW